MKKILYLLVALFVCCLNLILTVTFVTIIRDEDADSVLGKIISFGRVISGICTILSFREFFAIISWIAVFSIGGRYCCWLLLQHSWWWLPLVFFLEAVSFLMLGLMVFGGNLGDCKD